MISASWSVDVFVHKQCNFKVGRRGNNRRMPAQSPRICINQSARNTCLSSWRNCTEPNIIYAHAKHQIYCASSGRVWKSFSASITSKGSKPVEHRVQRLFFWTRTLTISFSVKTDQREKPRRNKAAQASLSWTEVNTEMPVSTLCFSTMEGTV